MSVDTCRKQSVDSPVPQIMEEIVPVPRWVLLVQQVVRDP